MLYFLIAVEGESEKGPIKALVRKLAAQASNSYGRVEIVPISVGGNHGYRRLVEVATNSVNNYLTDPGNCYEKDDVVEKWLVCDYDDMDKMGVTRDEFKNMAEAEGFSLVISKPRFEFSY